MTEEKATFWSALKKTVFFCFRLVFLAVRSLYRFFRPDRGGKAGAPGARTAEGEREVNPEGLKSQSVRWDLIEKKDVEEPQTGPLPPGTRPSTGLLPPATRGIARRRKTEPPKPFSEEARRAAVKMALNSSDEVQPRILDDPLRASAKEQETVIARSRVLSTGEFIARGPQSFVRGQGVTVIVPEQNFTFKAQVANVGASELMFTTGVDEALQASLQRGQRVILHIKLPEGQEFRFDAEVSGTKGRHSAWFSVPFGSMKSRSRPSAPPVKFQGAKVGKPARFCVTTDENAIPKNFEDLRDQSGISRPFSAVLRNLSESRFFLLLHAKLPKGACIFQLPGSGSDLIDDLMLCGRVDAVTENSDADTKVEWPFMAILTILKSSDKLRDVIRTFYK